MTAVLRGQYAQESRHPTFGLDIAIDKVRMAIARDMIRPSSYRQVEIHRDRLILLRAKSGREPVSKN